MCAGCGQTLAGSPKGMPNQNRSLPQVRAIQEEPLMAVSRPTTASAQAVSGLFPDDTLFALRNRKRKGSGQGVSRRRGSFWLRVPPASTKSC